MLNSNPQVPANHLIGRDREVTEVVRLLSNSRLLTVLGPGGAGKTRLALEVLERQARAGVVVRAADLASTSDPAQVELIVARAIGLQIGNQGRPLEHLAAHLGPDRLVLLLDNCEHLIAECARVAELVVGVSRRVRVLATSREVLGTAAETVWTLPPLSAEDAVRLFTERARARRPDLELAAGERRTVAEICRRLDHNPLSIELAAARIGLLSPDEIRQRLDDRFALLTGGGRAASDRHRTLRSTVDWSYGLLDPQEQQLFRALSVFRGGFDLTAVESVTGAAALDRLARLVDKSLVVVRAKSAGPTRYALLETLAEYGRERLAAEGEAEKARGRHLDHFLARSMTAFGEWRRTGSARLLHGLDDDVDNLRAALEWCRLADPCAGLRLVAATRDVWFRLGQAEGLRAARELLGLCPVRDEYTAWAHLAAGNLGLTQMEHGQARIDLEVASRMGAEGDDPAVQAWAAWMRGVDSFLAEEFEAANALLEESIVLHRRAGDAVGLGLSVASLGTARFRLGDQEGAVNRLREALDILESAGDVWGRGFCHTYLGLVLLEGGEPEAAAASFRQALETLAPIREVTMLSLALGGMAELAAGHDWLRAMRLAGAASALRDRFGGPFPGWIARNMDDLRRRGIAALGEAAGSRELEAGRQLRPDAAVAVALGRRPEPGGPRGPLSPREEEVATLVAEGLTNAEIAARIHLSRRTVENHVLHILNKIGAANRTQVAGWVLTRN
ncbi:MAG: LuxR family transcriptional regulator [Candidatus Dormibacteraceae bacterium]